MPVRGKRALLIEVFKPFIAAVTKPDENDRNEQN